MVRVSTRRRKTECNHLSLNRQNVCCTPILGVYQPRELEVMTIQSLPTTKEATSAPAVTSTTVLPIDLPSPVAMIRQYNTRGHSHTFKSIMIQHSSALHSTLVQIQFPTLLQIFFDILFHCHSKFFSYISFRPLQTSACSNKLFASVTSQINLQRLHLNADS